MEPARSLKRNAMYVMVAAGARTATHMMCCAA